MPDQVISKMTAKKILISPKVAGEKFIGVEDEQGETGCNGLGSS